MGQHDVSGETLRELAWEQGSLLPNECDGLAFMLWAHPQLQASREADSAVRAAARRGALEGHVIARRELREGERLAITTQTCDIVRDPSISPGVEAARVFYTSNPRTVAESQNLGSARYYRLNNTHEPTAAILDVTWRMQMDKGFLVAHGPNNQYVAGWSDEQKQRLARWLGRRYSRPILSDTDDAEVARPVRDRWKRLLAEEPVAAQRYTASYAEFRFRRLPTGLAVYLLSPDPYPDDAVAFEIADLMAAVLEPIHGQVIFPTDRRSYHTFTLADLAATHQIDLEWASDEEADAAGALPAE